MMLVVAATIHGAEFLALPAFAAFVMLAATECGPAYRVLAHPISVWLGDISFSVYLIHFIPLDLLHWAVEPAVPRWTWIACQIVFVPAVLAVSHATYEWFEMPAKRLLTTRPITAVSAA
jgi:peptidoglycan/LPS O-acetylase OafA/YrhL